MIEESSFRSDHLGVITHGSLKEGIEMKLDPSESVENVVAGTFVVIQGDQFDFFCMITDVEIEAANEQILLNPPDPSDDLLREVMQGSGTYVTVQLKPMLMMPNDEHHDLTDEEPRSVKTVARAPSAKRDDQVPIGTRERRPFGFSAFT